MQDNGPNERDFHHFSERLYKLLMTLYPLEHRSSYEVPMLQVFRDVYRDEVKNGSVREALKFWLFILRDAARSILHEQLNKGANDMPIRSIRSPGPSAILGSAFLSIPAYFVAASLLKHGAPEIGFLSSPIFLLSALFIAFLVNSLSIMSVNVRKDKPHVLSVSLSLRMWNIAVIVASLLLLGILLGYAFLENFAPRPIT
jgi:hypothetical protein